MKANNKHNKHIAALATACLLTLGAFTANADPIISNIDLQVRNSGYTTDGSESPSELLGEFNSGSLVCDTSIAAVDDVGSVQSCGGPTSDIATLITLDMDLPGSVLWQFGADWGRGGMLYATVGGSSAGNMNFPGDYWWAYSWTNSDVIEFGTNGGFTDVTLGFLGFEGCCGGGMSLRYSTNNGETWQIAAVNVPEPSTLALLGLGLVGAGLIRRRRQVVA